jgi:hypothetical protein
MVAGGIFAAGQHFSAEIRRSTAQKRHMHTRDGPLFIGPIAKSDLCTQSMPRMQKMELVQRRAQP